MRLSARKTDEAGAMVVTNEVIGGRPPHLEREQLLQAQAGPLPAARRRYGVLARILFMTLDALYGRQRTISKFKVLELVARVPYQSWEQIAYIAITDVHARP